MMARMVEPLRSDVLARLLMIQSTAGQLPNDVDVVAFICRGLEEVPGVDRVWHAGEQAFLDNGVQRFPIRFGTTSHGDLCVSATSLDEFTPYSPHIQNLVFIVAVMLEERRQRRIALSYQRELEQRIEERTRDLRHEVIERAHAESRALSEKHRAENYLEISEAIILELDMHGRVVVANQRLSSLLGYSMDEVIGQDWFELAIDETIRPGVREEFDALVTGKVDLRTNYENAVRARDGRRIEVAWHNALRYEAGRIVGTLSSGIDITERSRVAASLAAERDLLAVTLRSIGDGVITTDNQGLVALTNPVAEELTGWSQEQAQGRPLSDIFVIRDERDHMPSPNPVELVLKTLSPMELSNHAQLISRDGTVRAISHCAAPIRSQSAEVLGVVLVFRDVTERYRLLEQAQRAERLDAIGVLAGGIAHDFNNLLAGIFGYLGLARELAASQPELLETLDCALAVFERAKDLTRQLLTFSKGGAPVRSSVDLRRMLKDCVRFALSGSNLSCEFEFEPNLPEVEADPNQIWRVMDNLVRNAVQAMPTGGKVEVAGRATVIEIGSLTSLNPGQYVLIQVRDNGPGIPPDILPRIFDPFFTTKELGSGLGLATAYSVIRKHEGHITVESAHGQGTCFRIYLPTAHRAVAPAAHPPSATRHLGRGRALVLEDEGPLRDVYARYLSALGYDVTTTQDGRDAIALADEAAHSGRPFALALCDLTIPGGMGGQEAMRVIRERHPALIAIAASGYAEGNVMARPAEFGFTASLPKPFSAVDLSLLLEKLLPPRHLDG